MHIVIVGMNHESAPVEVRERISFTEERARASQKALRLQSGIYEAAILSTCNRVEVYVVSVCAAAAEAAGRSILNCEDALYVHRDADAVEHLFRVASGADSMIVGETQILGQVRRAFEIAHEDGAAGRILSSLFQHALRTGKRARTETGIGQHTLSISSAAVDLARRRSGSLENRSVLVIGTGDVAEHVVTALRRQRNVHLTVASRTRARARARVEEWGCSSVSVETVTENRIDSLLERADIVIAATTVSSPIVSVARVQRGVAGRTAPLVIVDIGVPRNIDPRVRGVENVEYLDIDDVQSAIAANGEARLREVGPVRAIAAEEAASFMSWLRALWVQPLVVEFRSRAEEIRVAELERVMGRLRHLSEHDRRAIETLTRTIINKLLHEPTVRLKQRAGDSSGSLYAEALRTLFNLEQQP